MAWETPYSEGSAIRSTGYDPAMWWRSAFTVAPEFNQTLTVQPDGYVMLKDAGMVEVAGTEPGRVQRGGAEGVPGISARSAGGGGAEGI